VFLLCIVGDAFDFRGWDLFVCVCRMRRDVVGEEEEDKCMCV
jgi:hypothetical protein